MYTKMLQVTSTVMLHFGLQDFQPYCPNLQMLLSDQSMMQNQTWEMRNLFVLLGFCRAIYLTIQISKFSYFRAEQNDEINDDLKMLLSYRHVSRFKFICFS